MGTIKNFKGVSGHTRAYKGHSDDWITPKHILAALGTFDLDPCSSLHQPWKTANNYYTIMDDGLNKEWVGRVWLNSPYGPETGKWLEKLSIHNNGIALTFARTETKMFFNHVWGKADSILFIEGRLYFHYPDGSKAKSNSGGPSILIAYGEENGNMLKASGLKGAYLKLK